MQKDANKQASHIRQEYERISNEIKMKYTHKMLLLRKEMDNKRKKVIDQIEKKKNDHIKWLTNLHDEKY